MEPGKRPFNGVIFVMEESGRPTKPTRAWDYPVSGRGMAIVDTVQDFTILKTWPKIYMETLWFRAAHLP